MNKMAKIASHADLGYSVWAQKVDDGYDCYSQPIIDAGLCIGHADDILGCKEIAREFFNELMA